MVKKEVPSWIVNAEKDIRSGKGEKVKQELVKLQKAGVPREALIDCAVLAKRVGMYQFGANILFREINIATKENTPQMLAEYAACLSGMGQYKQVQKIFESLPENVIRDYSVQYADSLFRNWNYEKGRDVLLKFRPAQWEDYNELVFGLNLASAHIECNFFDDAKSLLDEVLFQAQSKNHLMIEANCLELLGQLNFHQSNFEKAYTLFSKSEALLRKTANLSWVFSFKWMTFSEIAMQKTNTKNIGKLADVRKAARGHMYWEALRSCDLFEAIYTGNSELFNRVYFGSPSLHFRKKALKFSEFKFKLDNTISLGPIKKYPSQALLDLQVVKFTPEKFDLNWSSLSKNLLVTMTNDLFRPLSIFQIHQEVFNETYFDPESAKDKTYKIIGKFRDLIKNHPLGLSLESRRGFGYRFRCKQPIWLKYPLEQSMVPATSESRIIAEVKTHFGMTEFNRQDFSNLTSKSDRSASRLLKNLEEKGLVLKIGKGPNTKYKLVS